MKIESFYYQMNQGWSVSTLPNLDSAQTLVLIFGSPDFFDNPTAIQELVEQYPQSHVVGCSTCGEIFQTQISDQSLSVAVMRFDKTQLISASAPVHSAEESYSAGVSIAKQLTRPGLRGVFVLSDGVYVNGTELVNGLNDTLPENVITTGGLAGDHAQFQRTWTLSAGNPVNHNVSAVGFYGDNIHIGHGSKGGWDIFGPERKVTRSDRHILYELDGKPALELYKRYLGERASELPTSALLFPLALRSTPQDDKQIVRTVLGVDEATQSMTFAGDVPEGYLAQLMKANFDRLIDGAYQAASITNERTEAHDEVLSIAISCVGRRLVLGEQTEEELEAILDVLPAHAKQIGFYSHGEISPYTTGNCDLHNQTMTLTTISES